MTPYVALIAFNVVFPSETNTSTRCCQLAEGAPTQKRVSGLKEARIFGCVWAPGDACWGRAGRICEEAEAAAGSHGQDGRGEGRSRGERQCLCPVRGGRAGPVYRGQEETSWKENQDYTDGKSKQTRWFNEKESGNRKQVWFTFKLKVLSQY